MIKRKLACIVLIVLTIGISGCSNKKDRADLDTNYVSAFYAVDMNNPKEVVGNCTNVFVG